jgi:hypothetical protein
MEKLNNEGQWIVMIGFIVAISLFFLATVINESTLVGQTTAESVLDFSKGDIQDIRSEVRSIATSGDIKDPSYQQVIKQVSNEIEILSLDRKKALVQIHTGGIDPGLIVGDIDVRYNNGVTNYHEIQHYK